MTAVLNSGPLVEPVSLAEAKAHLRIDTDDEDGLLASLITSARLHIEAHLNVVLLNQSWSVYFDSWPDDGVVVLPMAPLVSVNAVSIRSEQGDATIISDNNYYADISGRTPRLVRSRTGVWPPPKRKAGGIEITLTAGYGEEPEEVPQNIRQAILLLTAHWFENRELVSLSDRFVDVPAAVFALLQPYRRARLA